MYVYHGGLNFFQHAVDEAFVIVIPGDFAPNDPICGYWQWTKDPISGWGRKNNPEQSVIKTSLQEPHGNLRIGFVLGDYTFDAVIGRSNLQVTMSNATRDKVSGINYLELSYSDETKIPSSRIYTAKFTWDDNTSEEMLTVVVPDEFLDEQPVCAYFQRTKEGDGEDSKERDSVVTRFAEGSSEENREVHASFTSNDGRTWDIRTEPANRLRITGMRVPGGDPTSVPLALIVRYDVGTDGGIFRVRDLLYMLGFHETSVEMLYYDLEPQNGPRICGNGQQAPTAKRFKRNSLNCSKVYSQETGWVPEQIHKNLTAGVNLTILIPSGSGGCINDNIRGILFAGCHESQTSVKVNDMDPWTLAIRGGRREVQVE
ncbi:hypothetical protein BD779DRAFT_1477569 [Infundibulicybe gibba]|nr:hypothetical protein BD779DRAFT_1477569 [Infundibulicybe gibba]